MNCVEKENKMVQTYILLSWWWYKDGYCDDYEADYVYDNYGCEGINNDNFDDSDNNDVNKTMERKNKKTHKQI